MRVNKLIDELGFKLLTKEENLDKEIENLCCCDLLSWVMAKGKEGDAWITVQTHANALAVASLLDFACIIVPENIKVDADVIAKANDEDVIILGTDKNAFNIFKVLHGAGLE